MHFSRFTFRKAFLSLCLVLPLYLMACGDDSSSNAEEPSIEDGEEDNLGGDEFRDTTITGTNYNSKTGSASIIKSEILDVKSGNSYKTIQFGPYTWMAENANYKVSKSSCYDGDYENCESNGRLYQSTNADQACPSGFKIPSEADYEYMLKFAKSVTDPAFGFDPQMSGSCETVNSELQCKGQGKESYLMTSDFNVFKVTSKGKAYFEEANFSAYYAVRCMKMSHFVETESQLPTCDSSTYKYLDDFFVASKGKNYYCNKKKWVKDDENSCLSSERGEKHYYKDTLFICKNNTWEYATMNDVDASCTKKNQWEVQKLNGQSYICDDSTWRMPTNIESSIGLCNNDSLKKMAVFENKKESIDYICDSIGWRKAVLTDSIGKCTQKRQWEQETNYSKDYVCDDTTWREPTKLEMAIGICSPDSLKKQATFKDEKDTIDYACDSTGWRKAEIWDKYGACDKSKYYKIYKLGKDSYTCRKNNKWEQLSSVEDSLGFCTPDMKGKLDTIGTSSYYYCDDSGWRQAVADDYLGICDSTFKYKMKYLWGDDYGCKDGPNWEYLEYPESDLGYCVPEFKGVVKIDRYATSYICDTKWRTATKAEALGTCSDENEGKKSFFKENKKMIDYVCAFGSWREETRQDDSLGVCTTSKLKKIGKVGSTEYICTSEGWVVPTLIAIHDSCTADRENELVQFQNKTYVCRNNRWTGITGIESINGLCTTERENELVKYLNYTYVCKNKRWTEVTGVESISGICTADRENEPTKYQEAIYVCRNKKWQQATGLEAEDGICTTQREDEVVVYSTKGDIYQCKSQKWTSVSAASVFGSCTETNKGATKTLDGVDFFCSQNKTWKVATDLYEQFGECSCDIRGKVITFKGKKYGCIGTANCKNPTWVEYTPIIEALGLCDNYNSKLQWREYNGKDYTCKNNKWEEVSTTWEAYGSCNKNDSLKYGILVGYKGQHYYCEKDLDDKDYLPGWHPLTAIDSVNGVCTRHNQGDTITYNDNPYYCKTKKDSYGEDHLYDWIPAPTPDVFFGRCDIAKEGQKGKMKGRNYVCFDNKWEIDPADYGSVTDARDGRRYKTIKIGKQEWIAENLQYNVEGSWCGGNHDGCATYGRLYSWDMVIGQPKTKQPTLANIEDPESLQGICPNGWRVPSTTDWATLLQECSAPELRKNLAGRDSIHTDVCGFSALETGFIDIFYRNGIDYTEELTIRTYADVNTFFWSSEQVNDTTATRLSFENIRYSIKNTSPESKINGYPLRCIKK